jgi:hypothetical protein
MDAVNPEQRIFVSYIDKSREYYLAQGDGNPYRWAYHRDAPFAGLRTPLARARVGLVTTAAPLDGEADPKPGSIPKVVFASPVEPPPARLYTRHHSWDKEATHTDDLDSFAPINRLREAAAAGRIGSLAPRFYGIPTEYSQRKTNEIDAPEVLRLCREDRVDAAILVAL